MLKRVLTVESLGLFVTSAAQWPWALLRGCRLEAGVSAWAAARGRGSWSGVVQSGSVLCAPVLPFCALLTIVCACVHVPCSYEQCSDCFLYNNVFWESFLVYHAIFKVGTVFHFMSEQNLFTLSFINISYCPGWCGSVD